MNGDPQRESMERIQGLAKGDKGDRGERGPAGRRGLPVIQGRAVVVLFLISVAISAFAVWWVSYEVSRNNAEQRREGQVFEQKLCATFRPAAALVPPAGNPARNPSRAYLQGEHLVWTGVLADLKCSRLTS